MKSFSNYTESLDFIKSMTLKKNQYLLRKNVARDQSGNRVPTRNVHTLEQEKLVKTQMNVCNTHKRIVVKKKGIERFHPTNIDNKKFWVEARKRFPLLSVCGAPSKNITRANAQTLEMSKHFGLFSELDQLVKNSSEKLNVLEIGFGLGNVFLELKDKCNYFGIDYLIPKFLKKHKNFIEIDKSGIPDYLQDIKFFDVVYSVNVLQHCSQKDRFDYIRQAYTSLKPGGYFIFSLMLMTEINKNDPCWGVIDENNRGYLHFFNQLTECDWEYELNELLTEIGFKVIKIRNYSNFYAFIVQK